MSPHIDACDACLWRTELVAALAGRLEIRWRRGTVVRTAVLTLPDEDLIALDGGDATALANALAPDRARHRLLDRGLGAVCRHAAAYPPALHELPDPPAVLHIAGDPAALAPPLGLALVGARRGTPYGIEVARTLGRGVAEAGVPVVSGLALGVDAAAHAGALSGSDPLVGVLAGGADLAYPANSRRLRERVIQRGCVVS
jgi:DNA processing protein